MLLMFFLPFLTVIMRGQRTVREHSEYSMTVLSPGSVREWSRRTSAVWEDALSWFKNHELSVQNISRNGVKWSFWNTNSVSKVSNCFLCTNSLIWLMCCSSVDVDGRSGLSKSSTHSLPTLKSLYYL